MASQGYRVICNTAAGRRRYMQYLIPFVVADEVVDRYDIWVNTHDLQDIAFFRLLAERLPKLNLVYQPDGIVNGIHSINVFYRDCVDEAAIYCKLDDDLVWMEHGVIAEMVRFRIEEPQHFLVSPLVINNPICTYILQHQGKLPLDQYYRPISNDPIIWKSGVFAEQLHTWFLEHYLKTGRTSELHSGTHLLALNRLSINTVLWFGREMAKFGGVVPGDDEEWLSVIRPAELGVTNAIHGGALVSHFAFGPQRAYLDASGLLDQYGAFLETVWPTNPALQAARTAVCEVLAEVEARKEEILAGQPLYQRPARRKKTMTERIGRFRVPVVDFRALDDLGPKAPPPYVNGVS